MKEIKLGFTKRKYTKKEKAGTYEEKPNPVKAKYIKRLTHEEKEQIRNKSLMYYYSKKLSRNYPDNWLLQIDVRGLMYDANPSLFE